MLGSIDLSALTPTSNGNNSNGSGGGGVSIQNVAMANRVALLQQIQKRQLYEQIKALYKAYDEDTADPVVAKEMDALSQSISQVPTTHHLPHTTYHLTPCRLLLPPHVRPAASLGLP